LGLSIIAESLWILVTKRQMKLKTQLLKQTAIAIFLGLAIQSQAQEFKLDPGHTLIEFNVERFMVGEVTGKFNDFEGLIRLDQNDELKDAYVTIQTESLDTDHDVRDGHLKGGTWLDVENYPEIKFESSNIKQENNQFWIEGDLTIKGQTKKMVIPFELKGPFVDPTGATTIGLTGDLVINRQDFGIQFSRVMDNGELFIGNEVRIRIRALALQN